MLALIVSATFIVYLLIPEGIFRLVFGLFISSRNFVLTRTEKAYRAVLITILPFLLAWFCSWYVPLPRTYPFPIRDNSVQQRRSDYRAVFAGFYSDSEFVKLGNDFWPAVTRCARRQGRLVSWYFLLVGLESLGIGMLVASYPKLKDPRLKWISNSFLTAYISQWHPLLPKRDDIIVQVDILCTNDLLYQGELLDYFLKDGELSGMILKDPRRFDRTGYLKEKDAGNKPDTKAFWRPIPSKNLYFLADKIVNVNLTYLTPSPQVQDLVAVEKFLMETLRGRMGKLTLSVKRPGSENPSSPPTRN